MSPGASVRPPRAGAAAVAAASSEAQPPRADAARHPAEPEGGRPDPAPAKLAGAPEVGHAEDQLPPILERLPVVGVGQAGVAESPVQLRAGPAVAEVLARQRPERAAEALLHERIRSEGEPVAGELRPPRKAVIRAAERELLVPADLSGNPRPDAHVAAGR